MVDFTGITSNQQTAKDEGKRGLGKVGAAILSGIVTTYIMNKASLHGVDFTLLGIPSELVKSTIDGTIIGTLVGFTPAHFVAGILDGVVFVRTSWRKIVAAWVNN